MAKIDFKKDMQHLYQASAQEPAMVEVPAMKYLMRNGWGDPNTNPEFPAAVEALYTLAYTIKSLLKKEQGLEYVMPPLEGLWWMLMKDFDLASRDDWRWTVMIMQPEEVTQELLDEAVAAAKKKKALPELEKIRLETFDEGQAAQILHVGPYADEAAAMDRLHSFIRQKGYHFCGKHHEIYLSDPRRTPPEKLKTILRQGVTLEAMK